MSNSATTEQREKTQKNYLRNTKVMLKFIPDFRNGITDNKHPLYGGLSSNASIGICAPLLKRRIDKIFTQDELEFLGKRPEINEDIGPTSPFWREYRKDEMGMPMGHFPIFLKKEGDLFDMSNPIDYIKVKILADCGIVAPNEKEIINRSSEYRFVLIDLDKEHQGDIDIISAKKAAMKLFDKIEKDEDALRYVLKSFNKNVSYSSKLPFLQKEVWNLMEADPARFQLIVGDELMESKIVLDEAVRFKLISRSSGLYYTSSGDPIKLDGHNNDFKGASMYLASGAGQEMRLKLEAQIKDIKSK